MTDDEQAVADRINLLVGCVNLRQMGDDAPGTLLFAGGHFIRILLVRDPEGWNKINAKDGKLHIYPSAEFPRGLGRYVIQDLSRLQGK